MFQITRVVEVRGGGDVIVASRPPEEILWFGCGFDSDFHSRRV